MYIFMFAHKHPIQTKCKVLTYFNFFVSGEACILLIDAFANPVLPQGLLDSLFLLIVPPPLWTS